MNRAMKSHAPERRSARADFLRDEALRLMDGGGAILDSAREISGLMREAGLSGAVIGGIAVVLHGHLRTTKDIDILVADAPERFADLLTHHGFQHDRVQRAFVRAGIAVHLVLPDQVGRSPQKIMEIDGITTVSLVDLIEMKLRSGTRNLLRAQDLADVIGLMRQHRLSGQFASRLEKDPRPDFRNLARAIAREG
jgi:hypothetical protein